MSGLDAIAARRPTHDEAGWLAAYVEELPPATALEAELAAQPARLRERLGALPDAKARHRYTPTAWSLKDIVGHCADAERVFAYRAMRFARGDATELAGFDENAFTAAAHADTRPLADLLDELAAVRTASIALLRGLPTATVDRHGVANGNRVTVRALAWGMAGHLHHHRQVIEERYAAAFR